MHQQSSSIAVLFDATPREGAIAVTHGILDALRVAGDATISGNAFNLPGGGRLEIVLTDCQLAPGDDPTVVRVETGLTSFSFLARDVQSTSPIWIPEFNVAVVPAGDPRDLSQVAADIGVKRLESDFDRFEREPEESYDHAAERNRRQVSPTWLGLGRDLRMFWAALSGDGGWGYIQPVYHSPPQSIEFDWPIDYHRIHETAYELHWQIGQRSYCRHETSRRLEDGVLPILRSTQIEQDVHYISTMFATLETRPLQPGAVRGSDWRVTYLHTSGNRQPPEAYETLRETAQTEIREREEEVVLWLRIEAVNTGRVPRYAWFSGVKAQSFKGSRPTKINAATDRFANGCRSFACNDKVYAVHRMDGAPLAQPAMAVLVPAGETVTWDILLPHSALDADRARALMTQDFETHLDGCRRYWRDRLNTAARICLPETPIDETVQAALLHCDLATLGSEPDGPALATVGEYAPIGTESSPIIQFYDSIGWHTLAERCLQFFFERQQPDGFIQNFGGYQSETGPVLWTAGEHFRYTRDLDWLRRVAPNLKKAADYLLQWRERNKTDEQRANGCYGMIDGKVADPEVYYHNFFLNAGTYIGLRRAEEMLREIDPDYAAKLAAELPAYRNDIRTGFYHAQARARLVPLGDGSWAPVMPAWVESDGNPDSCISSVTGPIWLILCEVIDPHEIGAEFLLKSNQYPATLDNAARAQPYYVRHDYAHLRRGEGAAFLKTYYNQLTGIHDRETYTFWENYSARKRGGMEHPNQHKTHEAAWFLMQTRWMLWMEQGDTLDLLPGVPRAWLADGKTIALERVASHFGRFSLRVESDPDRSQIRARIEFLTDRRPASVRLRLPHPERRKAVHVADGQYDAGNETVTIAPFSGRAELRVDY